MRRGALVVGLMVALILQPMSAALASVWAVSISANVGGASVQAGFQVTLADPQGGATANAGGVPVTVARTADAFGVAVNVQASTPNCVTAAAASGSGPIQNGVATGSLTGDRVETCSGVQPADPNDCDGDGDGLYPDGDDFNCPTGGSADAPIAGTFIAHDITGTSSSTLLGSSGRVIFNTPFGQQLTLPGGLVQGGTEIETGPDGRAVLAFENGTQLTVDPNTRVALSPSSSGGGVGNIKVASGQIDVTTPAGQSETTRTFNTATAEVHPTGTDFSIQYTQTGLTGSTAVTVRSGIAEVKNRRGQLTTLVAGQQASFDDTVPRVLLILPTDQGSLVAGRTNTFTWTSFAGAINYLVEFSVSPTGFARPNATTVETPVLTLRVPLGGFTEGSGLVSVSFAVPTGVVPPGTRVQYRVFPADGSGQVLSGATASDANAVVVQ